MFSHFTYEFNCLFSEKITVKSLKTHIFIIPNPIQWWRIGEVTQKGSKESLIIDKALVLSGVVGICIYHCILLFFECLKSCMIILKFKKYFNYLIPQFYRRRVLES